MTATTYWEANSIIIDLDQSKLMLYEDPYDLDKATHGFISRGSVMLHINEAKQFLKELMIACDQYDAINRDMESYFKEQEKENE